MSDENIENNKKEKGRPTKLTGIIEEQIARLFELGLTDAQVSYGLKIARSTLSKWKKENPDFSDTIKKAKAIADSRVEVALYQSAIGYQHPEDKIFIHDGDPIIVPTIKHYPPNVTAGIFWKKNRDPDRWKDKQEIEHSGNAIPGLIINTVSAKPKKGEGD